MSAEFISKTEVYSGNYSFRKVTRENEAEYTGRCHYHDFFELQFYLCESKHSKIGKISINGEEKTLEQGCLILINMFDEHQINITCEEPYVRYCICFDSGLLLFASSDESNLFNIYANGARVNFSDPLTNDQIAVFTSIYHEYEKHRLEHGQDILEKSLILKILAYTYSIFYKGQKISEKDRKHLSVITELISYIDTNIAEDLSLDCLASHVNFSTFHLSRIFKSYTGTTLNQYIISKRIDKAKLMLRQSESIAEVSSEVGFNNYNHFYRTFKKVTGMSPQEYKDSITEEKK